MARDAPKAGPRRGVLPEPPKLRRGRRKGSKNKVPADIVAAVRAAGEIVGESMRESLQKSSGLEIPNGTTAYLVWLALNYPEHYVKLMGKIIPAQVNVTGAFTIADVSQIVAERRTARRVVNHAEARDQSRLIDIDPAVREAAEAARLAHTRTDTAEAETVPAAKSGKAKS